MRLTFCSLLLAATLTAACPGAAQADGGEQAVYIVTHVDIAPLPPPSAAGQPAVPAKTMADVTADGEELLRQFAAESRGDPGCIRFDVLQEPLRRNHFTLIQVWRDENAFMAHESAAHTRATREKLQPILGGPFDQRLHHLLQ